MTLTYLYDMIHVISSPGCGSTRDIYLNYIIKEGILKWMTAIVRTLLVCVMP